MNNQTETIVAPITAPVGGAVNVVRVSGGNCRVICQALCARALTIIASPRELVYSEITDATTSGKSLLDMGLVSFFPGPESFTGEDCLEFNIHGSPFILSRLLENVTCLGARNAEPGEFTKRAFINGKLDLSQAEAVADLVLAETEAQARVAREQLEGKLSGAVSELGEPLRELMSEIEAHIDFPEEDITPKARGEWQAALTSVNQQIEDYLESFRTGRLYREGVRVAIAGLPNAGKSSLLNCLLGEERAIVTEHAGTTRDTIEERISIDGVLVRLCDTAGISAEESKTREIGEVEKLGVERSWKQISEAELVLYVFDLELIENTETLLLNEVIAKNANVLLVGNKLDCVSAQDAKRYAETIQQTHGLNCVLISALGGNGTGELKAQIAQKAFQNPPAERSLVVSNRRHYEALASASTSLEKAREAINDNLPAEFVSVDLRSALGALDEIIGVTHTEEILGRIFSRFCIGK